MTAALSGVTAPDVYGYTTADLHALPDDGRRWELIDGSLIVSPSATIDHNAIARWIAQILEDSAPDGYVVGTDQSATIDDHKVYTASRRTTPQTSSRPGPRGRSGSIFLGSSPSGPG